MRGLRIWHLAALALSVPLLTAAVPSGCTGGLNPNFRQALGQNPGSGVAVPNGYILLGIFDETIPGNIGYGGYLDFSVQTRTGPQAWSMGFTGYRAETFAWACDVSQISIIGGEVFEVDPATGTVQNVQINYDGPAALSGNGIGDALECGTFIKVTIVPAADDYAAVVEILK